MVDFNRHVHCLMGLPIDAVSLPQAAERLTDALAGGGRCFLSTPNLNFVIASVGDSKFRESVCRSDLSVADGMPLVWVAKLLGVPVRERVSGSNLFEFLRAQSPLRWNVFFFGGARGAGQKACLAIGDQDARMRPTGCISPGFGSVEQMSRPDIIECINESRPDLLVVSLGAAKGQEWICRNLEQLDAPVVSHLGAVVNFVAGTLKRAPRWMQRSGLEWLWRIKEQPLLYRRYLIDGLAFLGLLATQVLPLAIWQRLIAAPESEFRRATVRHPWGVDSSHVVLEGAWRLGNLDPVRREFTRLLACGQDVTLHMTGTSAFDSAFIGCLLLLDQALSSAGKRLRLTGLSPGLQRVLRLHGVRHLNLA